MIDTKELLRLEGEPYSDYYERLLASSHKADEARQTHETWKRRHFNGITEDDLNHRLLVVLRELLKSGFLRADYFDTGIPKRYQLQACKELAEMGFFDEVGELDGADWKYALFCNVLRKKDESRILIDTEAAGFYIDQMYQTYEKIDDDDVEALFRFATFTRLAYEEIDKLKRENADSQLNECTVRMMTDLRPLESHLAVSVDVFRQMTDEIIALPTLTKKIKEVSPNGFQGGYNQKLTCNLVGLMVKTGVLRLNASQADKLIYMNKRVYTYINNYADFAGTDSVLTPEELKSVKTIIDNYQK